MRWIAEDSAHEQAMTLLGFELKKADRERMAKLFKRGMEGLSQPYPGVYDKAEFDARLDEMLVNARALNAADAAAERDWGLDFDRHVPTARAEVAWRADLYTPEEEQNEELILESLKKQTFVDGEMRAVVARVVKSEPRPTWMRSHEYIEAATKGILAKIGQKRATNDRDWGSDPSWWREPMERTW